MKRSEIALVILIAGLAMCIAFVLAKAFFGARPHLQAQVEQVQSLPARGEDSGLTVNRRIFNEKALNPTVEVYIEGGTEVTNQAQAR